MKPPKTIEDILVQIKSLYLAFEEPSEISKKLKTCILTQVFELDSVEDQKECVGVMLTCCLESLNRVSKSPSRALDLNSIKTLVRSEVQELINIYTLIRNEGHLKSLVI